MEETGSALIEAVSPYGPGWIVAIVFVIAIIYLIAKLVPTIQSMIENKIEIEKRTTEANIKLEEMRENRALEEAKATEQRNIERGETEGRWVQAMEHSVNIQNATNVALDGMQASIKGFSQIAEALKASVDSLTMSIEGSRQKNAELTGKIDAIYDRVMILEPKEFPKKEVHNEHR